MVSLCHCFSDEMDGLGFEVVEEVHRLSDDSSCSEVTKEQNLPVSGGCDHWPRAFETVVEGVIARALFGLAANEQFMSVGAASASGIHGLR